MAEYEIQGGDTLYSIAKKFFGNGDKWPVLFQVNEDRIRAEQDKRHWHRYPVQDWIFPGTKLRVPELPNPCPGAS